MLEHDAGNEEKVREYVKKIEVLMDLKIAEDRSVALEAQEETDEQDDNIFQGMKFLCAEDNELNAEILTELLKIEGTEPQVTEQ